MFYKNARIFASDFQFHTGAFEVVDGVFGEVLPQNVPEDAIDLHGAPSSPAWWMYTATATPALTSPTAITKV